MVLQCYLGILRAGQGREIFDCTSAKILLMEKASGCSSLAFIFLELAGGIYSAITVSPLKTLPQRLFTIFSWHTLYFSSCFFSAVFLGSSALSLFPGRAVSGFGFSSLHNLPTLWFQTQASPSLLPSPPGAVKGRCSKK